MTLMRKTLKTKATFSAIPDLGEHAKHRKEDPSLVNTAVWTFGLGVPYLMRKGHYFWTQLRGGPKCSSFYWGEGHNGTGTSPAK